MRYVDVIYDRDSYYSEEISLGISNLNAYVAAMDFTAAIA